MSIIEKYERLLEEVERERVRSGRPPHSVKILPVTKGHPVTEWMPLYEKGLREFGESRVQEVLQKKQTTPPDISWHLIGSLQKKKVPSIIPLFALIHSVDSLDLAKKISDISVERGVVTSILFQINTSGEESKHGFSPAEFQEELPKLLDLPALDYRGLMTMAPLTEDERVIRSSFAALWKIQQRCQNECRLRGAKHTFEDLSMGMSHDFRLAIAEGATLLRIGSALFY